MKFSSALRSRKLLKGTLLTTASAEIAEAVSYSGLDWIFIDLEHSCLSTSEVQNIVRSVGGRIGSVIRVTDKSPTAITKALDTGCDGIIVPQVNTRAEALAVVEAAKYSPQGNRSVGLSRAQKYGLDFKGYINTANKTTSVIVQIENIVAVKNIDKILSVPGIDAIFIGPYDLSASMGKPGLLDRPDVIAAIETVISKAKKAGIPIGIYAATPEAAGIAIDKGITLLAVSTDILLLAEAIKKVAGIKRKTKK